MLYISYETEKVRRKYAHNIHPKVYVITYTQRCGNRGVFSINTKHTRNSIYNTHEFLDLQRTEMPTSVFRK